MTRARATAIGFTAVLLWSLLALLTVGSVPVPPFLLSALCFAIGGLFGLIWTARAASRAAAGPSWKVYAFGTAGLFGYHALYFTALRLAPTGRGRADRLSVAAFHRAVLGPAAGRAAGPAMSSVRWWPLPGRR
jgi:drug/metabolite transporter (DMT)-like permease